MPAPGIEPLTLGPRGTHFEENLIEEEEKNLHNGTISTVQIAPGSTDWGSNSSNSKAVTLGFREKNLC